MKIAYLLGSLNRGGTETLLLDVFRNASKNKLNAIGIYRKPGVYESEFRSCGVILYQLKAGKNPFFYLRKLRKLILENKVDIVHAQQPLDALYARIACLTTGIKIVLTFHGYDFNDKQIGKLILRFIIKRTSVNIYVSKFQRQYYIDRYKLDSNKQMVVYNGISFDKLDVVESNHSMTQTMTNLRSELQLSPKTLLFGSVGNFVPVRDQLTICKFLKILHEKNINFHFVFIGKKSESIPELYDKCYEYCQKNGLSGRVSFIGSRSDVPAILKQLDAFIYSTDHDTFGIAVVEAMAVGIPVFVNDWGVMTEITENGKFATIYKTKDETDLLRHFLLFLQNKQAFQTKAKEAAVFVRQKYSIENHIQNLKSVYFAL